MGTIATTSPSPPRRWFQFSLRTLLIGMTLFGCGLGWLMVKVEQARRQHAAVADIQRLWGLVYYAEQVVDKTAAFGHGLEPWPDQDVASKAIPPGTAPTWLRELLTDDFFRTVWYVEYRNAPITDEQFSQHLQAMPHLKGVRLDSADELRFSSGGVRAARAFARKRRAEAKLTDAALVSLAGHNEIETLYLMEAPFTDEGIRNLRGLKRLKFLHLWTTFVTAAGAAELRKSLPDCQIDGANFSQSTENDDDL